MLIKIIIPSHAIQKRTSVSARYGSKKQRRIRLGCRAFDVYAGIRQTLHRLDGGDLHYPNLT